MARKPEPRWYASRGGWYVWVDGRQHRLAVGKDAKAEAWRAYHRLMLDGPRSRAAEPITAAVLFDLLLDWIKANREPLTFEWYRRHLQAAADAFGSLKAEEVRPADVSRWLGRTSWSASTRHGAITAVKRAYRWGRKAGHVASDPLEGLEKPGIASRDAILTGEQVRAILDVADEPFRHLLTILHETGMRPSEAYRLTAADVDWSRSHVVFRRHKTGRKTNRPRVVYLTPPALELLRRLAADPEVRDDGGPLLRNRDGRPWTRHAVAHRFIRLRVRLGYGREATAESLRHLFVTDGLEQGVPVATVAQLAGHRSTAMIEKHYSHLHERGRHLLEAAGRIRGGPARAPEDVQGCQQEHPKAPDTR